MTLRSASAKLWYVSPSLTVRRSSMAWTFWSPERCNGESDGVHRSSDNSGRWRYLEDVRDGVVEMLPLLCVEALQLRGVLVLALVRRVRPGVELVLGLDIPEGTPITVRRGEQRSKTVAAGASHPLHVRLGGVDVIIQAFEGDLGLLRLFTLPLKLLFTLESKQSEAEG